MRAIGVEILYRECARAGAGLRGMERDAHLAVPARRQTGAARVRFHFEVAADSGTGNGERRGSGVGKRHRLRRAGRAHFLSCVGQAGGAE